MSSSKKTSSKSVKTPKKVASKVSSKPVKISQKIPGKNKPPLQDEEHEIILPPIPEEKLLGDVEVPLAEVIEEEVVTEDAEEEDADLETFGDSWEE